MPVGRAVPQGAFIPGSTAATIAERLFGLRVAAPGADRETHQNWPAQGPSSVGTPTSISVGRAGPSLPDVGRGCTGTAERRYDTSGRGKRTGGTHM